MRGPSSATLRRRRRARLGLAVTTSGPPPRCPVLNQSVPVLSSLLRRSEHRPQ
jgi:hypothetical protein